MLTDAHGQPIGGLTTHVLDTAHGRPAAAMRFVLRRWKVGSQAESQAESQADVAAEAKLEYLLEGVTNADGRADGPLVSGEAFVTGRYELRFWVGDYFAGLDHADARRFLDQVPLEFTVDDASSHYHVPLLVSPWSFSTYRGS